MNVELRDIRKSFGAVQANAGISLSVSAGTIQGLLGENGAGKSTLMKILSGFIRPDRGEILLDGKAARIASTADALRRGIGMLHQDPLDFPPLRVIDNFVAGRSGPLLPDWGGAGRALRELQREFDFDLDPEAYVDSLTVGERQQLEILRLLWLGARVLILDEPTTGISSSQKTRLFNALRRLAGQGRTIFLVSHKLADVEELCARAAVLRQGRLAGEAVSPFRKDQLVEMMFGPLSHPPEDRRPPPGETVLRLEGLTAEDARLRLAPLDLEVRAGEVIGLAGMEGSGQNLLLRAGAGLVRPTGGAIRLRGRNLSGCPYFDFLEQGITYVPAARLEEGLVAGLTLNEHFLLCRQSNRFFIQARRSREITEAKIREFRILGRPDSPVEELSGGNQQRALLALLDAPLPVILLEHPTRGLDVASAHHVWSALRKRGRIGTAILFTSSDLEELLTYSDRIVVFFNGRMSVPLEPSSTSVEKLGELIGGEGF